MSALLLGPAVAADAAAVSEVVVALESSLYGQTAFSQADLEDESSDLDLEPNGPQSEEVEDRIAALLEGGESTASGQP